MTFDRIQLRRRKGWRLFSFYERDIRNSEYGAFPREKHTDREGSFPSSTDLGPVRESYDSKTPKEQLEAGPQSIIGDTSGHQKKEDANERSNQSDRKKSNPLSRFLSTRSRLFQNKRTRGVNVSEQKGTEETVIYDDILNTSPDRQRKRNSSGTYGCNSKALDGGDETKLTRAHTKNDIKPFQKALDDSERQSSRKKSACPPPLAEIMNFQRRNSGSSDVSSLSGARDVTLEYFLALGMRGKAHPSDDMADDILDIIGRSTQVKQSQSIETADVKALPSCLVLLTDPMQRIFEMVSVVYTPRKDAVSAILTSVIQQATDSRLKTQTYVGLAYGGEHYPLETIPEYVFERSMVEGKPLLAIPARYSAHQIELVGKSLFACPSIQKLLENQFEAAGYCRNKTNEPDGNRWVPMTQIVVQQKRSSRKDAINR